MGKGSNSTSTTTSPNPQAMSTYQDLLQRAQGVSNTPYTPYGGEMVAPVNAQQNLGIAGINANANFAQPYIQTAGGMAYNAAQPITGQQIQQYSNPFTDQVINATQNQFNNQNAQQQQKLLGNTIMKGALGGNRVGIAQGELANQQNLAQAPVIAGLRSQGYTTGLSTALQEQQAQQAGAYSLGNLGVAGQSAGLTGANAQIGAGTLQQGTQQAQDAASYSQYMQKMGYPFQTAQWLAGIATGVGSQMGGTSSTQGPTPSGWSQGLGALSTGVGALGASGAFGAAGWMAPMMACLATGGAANAPEGIANHETYNTIPESHATLRHQQHQLMQGHRKVQMFPHGTEELPVPPGMERTTVGRDVFHYDPHSISPHEIKHHAMQGHEHKLLGLGPFSKHEILHRLRGGEIPVAVVERHPDGTEVRSAAGTHVTAPHQLAAMHHTKSPGNTLNIEDPHRVIHERMRACGGMMRAAGGGVAGDMSGSGIAGSPYAGGMGWIPGIGITAGHGAPAAPTLPASKPDDYSATGKQLGQLAKSIHDGLGPKDAVYDDVGTPVQGTAVEDSFSGMGPRARGGGVSGYADGGAPDFFDAAFDHPPLTNDLINTYGDQPLSDPAGSAPPRARGIAPPPARDAMLVNDPDGLPVNNQPPFAPARRPTASALPPAALGYSNEAPPVSPARDAPAGVAPPAKNTGVDWSENGKLWPSLMAAGLGMMASKSPNVGVAVGEGGLRGMETYSGLKTAEATQAMNQAKIDQAAKKLTQDADFAQKNLALKMLPYQGVMTPAQEAALNKPIRMSGPPGTQDFLVVRGKDGAYHRMDVDAPTPGGEFNPLKMPPAAGMSAPGTGPGPAKPINAAFTQVDEKLPGTMEPPPESGKDDEFLKTKSKDDANLIKGIASYEINPVSVSTQKGYRAYVLSQVKAYDPSYDQTLFPAKQRAVTEFFAGGPMSPAGTLTAGNTAILHLGEMDPMVDELRGQPGFLNKVFDKVGAAGIPWASYVANEVRNSAVKGTPEGAALANLLVARQRFTEEVTKFYSGSGGSEAERDRAIQLLDTAKSPEELHAAIKTDIKLMRDKVEQMQGRLIGAMSPGTWKQAVKRDPNLVLTYKNSRDIADKILGSDKLPPPGAPARPASAAPAATAPAGGVDARDSAFLKQNAANPQAKELIDKKYGAGTADRLLGAQ